MPSDKSITKKIFIVASDDYDHQDIANNLSMLLDVCIDSNDGIDNLEKSMREYSDDLSDDVYEVTAVFKHVGKFERSSIYNYKKK